MAHYRRSPSSDNATYKQWTPSTGTTHYVLINETMEAKETTRYVQATAISKRDQYGFYSTGPVGMANITKLFIYLYINTAAAGNLPGLTLKLMNGATELYSGDYYVNTGGLWKVAKFTITGLNITRAIYNTMQTALLSFAASGTEPTPGFVS